MSRIKYKEAVGIEAKKGKPAMGNKPEKTELKKLYIKESRSIREAAEILGCTKDMVYRALQEYGIELRPGFSRSKLRKYRLSDLEKGVKEKGIRGFSKELDVHENTLRYYLNGIRKGKQVPTNRVA